MRFAAWDNTGTIPAGDFFGAIEAWENCLLQLQMFYEVFNKKILRPKGRKIYDSGDGSVEQRVAEMANDVKHSGRSALTEVDLTPVWSTADGVAPLSGHERSYEELAEAVRDVAEFAERLQDPAGVAEEAREKVELPGDAAAEDTT